MKSIREQLLLYAVTDRSWTGRQSLYEQVESALKGGVTMVQLREKEQDDDAFLEEAIQIKALCHRYGVPLIINDRLSVALKSGADGIHVGAEDEPVETIRQIAGKDFIIGATAKTVEQAKRAQSQGADYLGVGAVFGSPTKKNAIRITKNQLCEICSAVSIPAVAIGGIDETNIASLKGAPIAGVAVVSAIFSKADIEAASHNLLRAAEQVTSTF